MTTSFSWSPTWNSLGWATFVVEAALISLGEEQVLMHSGVHFVHVFLHLPCVLNCGLEGGSWLLPGLLGDIQEALGPYPEQELKGPEAC